MPPQGEQTPNINPEIQSQAGETVENKTPEVAPIAPESKVAETFSDVQTPPVPVLPADPPIAPPVTPAVTDPNAPNPELDKLDDMKIDDTRDDVWVAAVDNVIERTKNQPYEEEESSEKLQADYLLKRFNKTIEVEDDKK
jgi:Txe/YoeB family toxin of Txe-Axe toxin-antitoxin module